jgi:hypothetical protein
MTMGLGLAGCQTMPPAKPVSLPVIIQPLFQLCMPGDGATTLKAFQSGNLLGSAETEWIAKADGSWDIEVSNVVGQVMLTLHRSGNEIEATGPLAPKLPRIQVDAAGFLSMGGHRVAIKADEVPCMLAFSFPRGWLPDAVSVDAGATAVEVDFADGARTMELEAKNLGKQESACATVSWPSFLMFHHHLMWCAQLTGLRQGSLSGLEDYSLQWVRIDER